MEERKKRIDLNNSLVILSNLRAKDAESSLNDKELIGRFNKLGFKYKIIFVDNPDLKLENCIYLKNWEIQSTRSVFDYNEKDFYRRYIDQFKYVEYLNSMDYD